MQIIYESEAKNLLINLLYHILDNSNFLLLLLLYICFQILILYQRENQSINGNAVQFSCFLHEKNVMKTIWIFVFFGKHIIIFKKSYMSLLYEKSPLL